MPRRKDPIASKLAALYNVSEETILRDAAYAHGIDVIAAHWGRGIKEAILTGQLRVSMRSVILIGKFYDRRKEPGMLDNPPAEIRRAIIELEQARHRCKLAAPELADDPAE